jgi:hypothetical protein
VNSKLGEGSTFRVYLPDHPVAELKIDDWRFAILKLDLQSNLKSQIESIIRISDFDPKSDTENQG